jgi:hypothetical protein
MGGRALPRRGTLVAKVGRADSHGAFWMRRATSTLTLLAFISLRSIALAQGSSSAPPSGGELGPPTSSDVAAPSTGNPAELDKRVPSGGAEAPKSDDAPTGSPPVELRPATPNAAEPKPEQASPASSTATFGAVPTTAPVEVPERGATPEAEQSALDAKRRWRQELQAARLRARAAQSAATNETAPQDDEAASLHKERESLSRNGPTTLIVLGSVVGLASIPGLSDSHPTSAEVAFGLGLTATIGGIVWLANINHRRNEIDKRLKTLETACVPVVDPTTRTAGLVLSGTF